MTSLYTNKNVQITKIGIISVFFGLFIFMLITISSSVHASGGAFTQPTRDVPIKPRPVIGQQQGYFSLAATTEHMTFGVDTSIYSLPSNISVILPYEHQVASKSAGLPADQIPAEIPFTTVDYAAVVDTKHSDPAVASTFAYLLIGALLWYVVTFYLPKHNQPHVT